MVNPYVASALDASIRRRAFMTQNDSIPPADIYAWLTDECQTYIAGILVSVRQEYLIASVDLPYATTDVALQVPPRAVAQGMRTVSRLDPSGVACPLEYIEPERIFRYGTSGTTLQGYTLEGQRIMLVPPGASGTLRVTYTQAPGAVVGIDEVAQVTGISGNVVTCAGGLPSGWVTGNVFDLCSQQAGFQNWSTDQAGTVSGSTVTFTAVPPTLAVGDFLTLSGQVPGPQCPRELYPLLCQRVAVKLAESMGSSRLADIQNMCEAQRKDVMVLLQPRVKDASHLLIRRNGPALRRGRWY